MKKKFSKAWIKSKQPRKQRKYRKNAPLHVKRKFVGSHLSKELRQKHGKRTIPVITGDRVKILRGQFKGKESKVEKVLLKTSKIFITGVDRPKKDGSKSMYPIHPSNLVIVEMNLDDKKRKAALQRKTGNAKTAAKPQLVAQPVQPKPMQPAQKPEPAPAKPTSAKPAPAKPSAQSQSTQSMEAQ